MSRFAFISLAAIWLGLLAAAPRAAGAAGADDAEQQARKQFNIGLELYEQGDFEKAAIAFTTAYELKPSYKILFNIAQTENELKHYARAIEAYRRYMDEGGADISPDRAADVAREISRLESLIGQLELICPIGGAVVMVDGERRGQTPLDEPITVDLGKHELLVKRGAREIHRELVRVGGGLTVTVEVSAREDEELPDQEPDSAPVDEEKGGRVWAWVALGVGGAAAVGAGVTGGIATSMESDLEKQCDNGVCAEDRRDEIEKTRALATATDVLIGVAAAGVATGVLLFFLEPGSKEDEGSRISVVPAATSRSAGLAVGGRF
jgi:hypothetical protein